MTDMRATERLLEVIGELVNEAGAKGRMDPTDVPLMGILGVLDELRRRGDTLVRAADLRAVLTEVPSMESCMDSEGFPLEDEDRYRIAIDRLESALKGGS